MVTKVWHVLYIRQYYSYETGSGPKDKADIAISFDLAGWAQYAVSKCTICSS